MSQQSSAPAPNDRSRLSRSYAMTLAGAGCWVLAAGLAYFLVYVIFVYAPGIDNESFVARVLPIFASLLTGFGVLGALALFWPGARRRVWFWSLPVVLAALVQVQNAQVTPYDLARPANSPPFLITIVAGAGALAAIVGGLVAFLEVRRGKGFSARSGRLGWLSIAVIGIAIGAALTSLMAGRTQAYGAAVATEPTTTQVLSIDGAVFAPSRLDMKSDEVLGLFIVNPTDVGHSFDIDSLDIHMLLPPSSTTAVTIRPTGPGSIQFYCSYLGHRAAGMAGTLTVQ